MDERWLFNTTAMLFTAAAVLCGGFALLMLDRAREYRGRLRIMQATVHEVIEKLIRLPQWREAMNVAGFMVYLSRREDVPEDIRQQARALLPLEMTMEEAVFRPIIEKKSEQVH